jgi:hypothetical protein
MLAQIITDPQRLLIETLDLERHLFEPTQVPQEGKKEAVNELSLLKQLNIDLPRLTRQARSELRQIASRTLTQKKAVLKKTKKAQFVNRGIFLKFFNIWEFLRMAQMPKFLDDHVLPRDFNDRLKQCMGQIDPRTGEVDEYAQEKYLVQQIDCKGADHSPCCLYDFRKTVNMLDFYCFRPQEIVITHWDYFGDAHETEQEVIEDWHREISTPLTQIDFFSTDFESDPIVEHSQRPFL